VLNLPVEKLIMSWLITDVRIFDGEQVTLENGFVVVKDGYIESISPKMPLNIPEGCLHMSGIDCTLLPGFIDSHVHVYNDASFLEKALRFGVTTLLDMHNEPYWFRDMKQLSISRNDVADVKSACHAATVKDGWPSAIIQLSSDDPEVYEHYYNTNGRIEWS
jgi:dihydroorotase-like cyclic amidohydrolase